MDLILASLWLLLGVYQLALIVRIIFDMTQQFARYWRPKGPWLMLAVGTYAVTDPPIRWLRARIPPVNLGGIALDVAFIIVFFVVIVLQGILINFA